MRYVLTVFILVCTMPIVFADRPVKDVVKHFNNLRIIYVVSKNGRQVPLVTNLDENGKPIVKQAAPAPDWSKVSPVKVAPNETILYGRSGTESLNPKITPGIPFPRGRSPHRPINPFQTVNPYRDPTAIPTPPSH